jgi:protein SCO1/2
MNISKLHFFLLALVVVSLGTVIGTTLWLKLTPQARQSNFTARPLEGLTSHGAVPEFSLVERSRKKITLAELRGKVWIADFIYTTCQDTCPLQTAEMAKLQEELHDNAGLKLVSFTVDPEHDTPAVLARYADHFKADATSWLFLTGDKDQIIRLIQEGFRLSAVPATDSGNDGNVFLHSPRFVLIDKEAQIRGYYDSRDPDALRRMRRDVATLLSNKKE